ncbi:MAG: SDR family NAD(P)-dependent oxidoreductase, partial [Acidobacteria bacterium]|nr:SDR family NAD(P)-dependent oxidoreductase [Acidobacteriota bacterium]
MKRTALVTGASRGLGRAIALELGAAGMNVVANYFNGKDGAEDLCDQIRKLGAQALAVKANVRNPTEIDALVTQAEKVKEKQFGRIIQIGSEVFELGNPRFANYVAAKGAQLGQTRSWARELAPTGITVNLVAPGWIPTERHVGTPQAEIDQYLQTLPTKKMGVPQD